jgi:uncharacterized caspase-like protein
VALFVTVILSCGAASAKELNCGGLTPEGDLYALMIGISRHRNPAVPDLPYAAQDAEALTSLLKSQRRLFKNIHVKILLNEAATKANLEKTLAQGMRLAGPRDALLLYFSGHGFADPGKRTGYSLIAYDTDPARLTETSVRYDPRSLALAAKAKQLVGIVDACRWNDAEDVPVRDFVYDLREMKGRIVIVSGRTKESEWFAPPLKHGVFAHFLLEGLKGAADSNADKIVTLPEAYDYAASRSRELTGGHQKPQCEGKPEGVLALSCRAEGRTEPRRDATPALGDLHCLVVGVSTYKNPHIPNLNYAGKDAEDFAAFLKSTVTLYRKTHVRLLMDEEATKEGIENALAEGFGVAKKDDALILFFSGHGFPNPDRGDEFFVAAHDTDPDHLTTTAVPLSGMSLITKVKARFALVVADACYAGASVDLQSQSEGVGLGDFIKVFRGTVNRLVIASSRNAEESAERPNLKNGVFTHFLLKGLHGPADADRDGVITALEAYEYAALHTRTLTNGIQHPEFEGKVEGLFPLSVVRGPQQN